MAQPVLPRLMVKRPRDMHGPAGVPGAILALLAALVLWAAPARAGQAPVTAGQPAAARHLDLRHV